MGGSAKAEVLLVQVLYTVIAVAEPHFTSEFILKTWPSHVIRVPGNERYEDGEVVKDGATEVGVQHQEEGRES